MVSAQSGCDAGSASAWLDVGNARMGVTNDGSIFRFQGSSNASEVPKGSGRSPWFQGNLMIGGLVDGTLRVSGGSYTPQDMWPGPYRSADADSHACVPYDRIYSISLEQPGGLNPALNLVGDVADWPAHLGAEVVDGDGTIDNYDVEAGDSPAIYGDQMLWWLMNDGAGEHGWYGDQGLGVEIRASAYAFTGAGALGLATFYRYKIKNVTSSSIRDAYFSMFLDSDLGYFLDDYVGSDSSLGLAYFYNMDDEDEGDAGYGTAPPAVGATVLKRPVSPGYGDSLPGECSPLDGKEFGFTSNQRYYGGGGLYGGPDNAEEVYNFLRGIRKDGLPMRIGGWPFHGDGNAPVTRYSFPGDPVTGSFWSQMNLDGSGERESIGDRRTYPGIGPFCLDEGEETEITIALIYSRGSDHLDSLRKLREDTEFFYGLADFLTEPRHSLATNVDEETLPQLEASVFPNPASTSVNIRYTIATPARAEIQLFNMLGRLVARSRGGVQPAGKYEESIDVSALKSGSYLARITLGERIETKKIMVIR